MDDNEGGAVGGSHGPLPVVVREREERGEEEPAGDRVWGRLYPLAGLVVAVEDADPLDRDRQGRRPPLVGVGDLF